MTSPIAPRHRPSTPVPVAALVSLALLVGLSCSQGDGDVEAGGGSTEAATSTIVPTAAGGETDGGTGSQPDDGEERDDPDRSAWVGRYLWDEFVEGDPGSDQTLVHELVLSPPAADASTDLAGRLTQNGFQTGTELSVVARPIEDGVAIEVVSVDAGLTSLAAGNVVFTLTGDPASPVTTIGDLIPLVVDRPATGAYFQRRSPPDDQDQADAGEVPATFWAIEASGFDLIEIEVASGQEIGRVRGWGADLAEPTEGGGQALQRLEVATDGWLWVDDCCEPAAGNTFGLDPDRLTGIDEVGNGPSPDSASLGLFGLNPVPSPDASLLAFANYTFEVAVIDRNGQPVASLLNEGDDSTFPTPLAWLDDVTLAVAEPTGQTTTVTIWDLSDPSEPVARGEAVTLAGSVVDASPWPGGGVLVVSGPDPFADQDRQGAIVDGAGVRPIDVPAGLVSVDLDATGRELLHVGADGLARLGPLDGTATVVSDIEVIWASW